MTRLEDVESRRQGDLHNARGVQLVRAGRLAEAIEEFRQALELCKRDSRIYYNLALALADTGTIKGALAAYKKAMCFDSTNPDYYFAQATCYAVLGPDWKTVACCQAYLELAPYGEKSEVARRQLRKMNGAYRRFDERKWLQALRQTYGGLVAEAGETGLRQGLEIAWDQARDGIDVRRTALSMSDQSMLYIEYKSIAEMAEYHAAAARLREQCKYRAQIVQEIEALEVYPVWEGNVMLVAHAYLLADELALALRWLALVDRQKLTPEQLIWLGKMLTEVQQAGHR
jgi:tetratricopeptide (TPR) repeat protein